MTDIPFDGDQALREPMLAALANVLDPEMALGILDVGLVYGISATPERIRVRMTMTSPACPVAETIAQDIEDALRAVVSDRRPILVELWWEPPWTPERMSDHARRAMGW